MAMIKCPECGERISTMAITCPHCGVAIKGHLHECPECGEWMLDSQKECPECGAVYSKPAADNSDATQNTADGAAETAGQAPEPEKKSNHLIWVIVALIILIGGGGGWGYVQYQIKLKNDEAAADSLNRMQDEAENAEMMRIQQQDSLDWEKALNENTVAAVERYMTEHPEGIFIDPAAELLNKLKNSDVSDNDKSFIRTALEAELTRKAADKKSGADADVIGVHYTLGNNMKVIKDTDSDGNIQYNVECQVNETITRSDPTKEGSRTFTLRAILDESKKIVEINL